MSADGSYGNRQPYISPEDGTVTITRYGPEPTFYHPGPAQIYLSRAPGDDDLLRYRGEGDWFKIAYAGPKDDQTWQLWPGVSDFNFTIPKHTPPGKYLMRIEHFMPTSYVDYKQFYVNCAFVNVIGSGGGKPPTEFARFPGTYNDEDPGELFQFLAPFHLQYLEPTYMHKLHAFRDKFRSASASANASEC